MVEERYFISDKSIFKIKKKKGKFLKKKKILLLFGDDLRNKYLLNKILEKYNNCKIIIQKRAKEKIKLNKKKNKYSNLMRNHLKLRDISERKYLKIKNNKIKRNKDIIYVGINELNTKKVIMIAKEYNPDLVVCCGISLIKKDLLNILPKKTINIHSGLTQKFRGYASNFWACYFLQPYNVGATIHYVIQKADSGNIIHQVGTDLKNNYNLHDLSSIAIFKVGKIINKIISTLLLKSVKGTKIKVGKPFLLADFKSEYLLLNYDLFKDRMASYFLKNNFKYKRIKLINLFK